MNERKQYIKPVIKRIELDNTISALLQSVPNPPPRTGDGSKGGSKESPFASPFSDKPFN